MTITDEQKRAWDICFNFWADLSDIELLTVNTFLVGPSENWKNDHKGDSFGFHFHRDNFPVFGPYTIKRAKGNEDRYVVKFSNNSGYDEDAIVLTQLLKARFELESSKSSARK